MKHVFSTPNPARDLAEATRWREYEMRKQAYIDADQGNPMVTPGVYDAAIRRIARECGI